MASRLSGSFLPGDPCPWCGTRLEYDAGERRTRDYPGYPPHCVCPSCGVEVALNQDYELDAGELM